MKKNGTTTVAVTLALLFLVVVAINCKPGPSSGNDGPPDTSQACSITPDTFPGTEVTGIKFPEDSNTILNWLNTYDTVSIAQHAWGLWAGLTSPTTQTCGKDNLLRFETWLGTSEIQAMMQNPDPASSNMTKHGRTPLTRPSQFHHAVGSISGGTEIDSSSLNKHNKWVTVCYDPTAARFALQNAIFKQSTLEKYMPSSNAVAGSIPAFPRKSITLKPTYLVVHNNGDSLIAMPVWPGQPSPPDLGQSFDSYWHYVFVDSLNRGTSTPTPVPHLSGNTPQEIRKATANLRDFIYFVLDDSMAAYINKQQDAGAKQGDLAILVGMHVATKEISNWTWQTFFWVPDVNNPPFPSSQFVASHRPKTVKGAAAHYAAVPVYNMVWPNPPVNGNAVAINATSRYQFGYNPYLEASLGNIQDVHNYLGNEYKWGAQTNCMSCHALAHVDKKFSPFHTYTADQYIPMDDKFFNGKLKVDFSWSIHTNIIRTSSNPATKPK